MKGGLLISAAGLILILFAYDMASLLLTSAIFNIGTSLIGPSSSALATRIPTRAWAHPGDNAIFWQSG